jgi:hypothetical protein
MDHCFVISWDPVAMRLTAALDEEQISYAGNIVADIFSGNALVYYGFSSGTGSLSNLHTVCFGPPELEPMDDETICEGESIDLQADANGIAWTWAPDPTLSALDESNPTATPRKQQPIQRSSNIVADIFTTTQWSSRSYLHLM